MKFNYVSCDDVASITTVIDGELKVANQDHPAFQEIVDLLLGGCEEDDVRHLFDVAEAISKKFDKLSERVSVFNGHVYFDGEEVNSTLTNTIVKFLNEKKDFKPLVNFFEKVMLNPNEHSREQLYRWLDKHHFTLSSEGDILAYKSVCTSLTPDKFKSVNRGRAIVDGVEEVGYISNYPGAVVEMPRSDVHHDPSVGCSTGLHVGTWDYVVSFTGDVKLLVSVNPRDVVSVPTDSNDEKMRVCRYKVLKVVTEPFKEVLVDTVDTSYPFVIGFTSSSAPSEGNNTAVVSYSPTTTNTKLNHTKQKRDSRGRFVK
jgi:hypothetical protein